MNCKGLRSSEDTRLLRHTSPVTVEGKPARRTGIRVFIRHRTIVVDWTYDDISWHVLEETNGDRHLHNVAFESDQSI